MIKPEKHRFTPEVMLIDPEEIETNYNAIDWTSVLSLSAIAFITALFFCHLTFRI